MAKNLFLAWRQLYHTHFRDNMYKAKRMQNLSLAMVFFFSAVAEVGAGEWPKTCECNS